MGFVERAFTPPGTGAYVPPPTTPGMSMTAVPTAAPVAAPPSPPAVPPAPAAPAQFSPGQAPGAKARAAGTASTMLGVAAAAGQKGRATLLGA